MVRTPEQAAMDSLRTTGSPVPGTGQGTMYGTSQGIATDRGAAEAVQRGARTPWASSPNNPAFHGDGRYGAPPNPTMPPAAVAAKAESAAAQVARNGTRGIGYTAGRAVGETLGRGAPGAASILGLGSTVGAISNAAEADSTARYAKRFSTNEPTGDGSLGDLAKFSALRAGGFASDLGVGILDAGTAVVNSTRHAFGAEPIPTFRSLLFRDGDPATPATPTAAPTARTAPTTAPVAQPAASPAAVPGAPAAPANVVTRSGNSFSGNGVREGFTYGGDGAPKGGGSLTVLPGQAYPPASVSYAGARAAQRELDAYGPGPNGGGASSFNAGGGGKDNVLELAKSGKLTGAGLRAVVADRGNEIQSRGQDHQLEIAQLNNATQRYSTDVGADVGLRGQDVQMAGHQMTAANARTRLQYDMGKDQRDYVAGRSDKNFEQRQARESQLQKNIEARTVNPDGTPDPVAAAAYRQGIDRSVARLGAAGAHELSPMDEQRLIAGSDLLKTMKANAGWLPWQPDQLKTIDPVDLTNLRVLKNGDRQITRADSKAVGQVIPGRFFDTEEGVRFFGGTKTNRYDILHEGK